MLGHNPESYDFISKIPFHWRLKSKLCDGPVKECPHCHQSFLTVGRTFLCHTAWRPTSDLLWILMVNQQPSSSRSVCKVNTQDPENFDEELKSLVTAWLTFPWCRQLLLFQEVAGQSVRRSSVNWPTRPLLKAIQMTDSCGQTDGTMSCWPFHRECLSVTGTLSSSCGSLLISLVGCHHRSLGSSASSRKWR